jgi:hypothetical protein
LMSWWPATLRKDWREIKMIWKAAHACRATFARGVGLIRVAGPVTLAVMREIRREIARGALMHPVERVLCDMRAAVVILDEDEWRQLSNEAGSRDSLDVPTGLLVGEEAIAPARAHCDRMNAQGRISLAFTTSSGAYRWLGVPAPLPARSPSEVAQD